MSDRIILTASVILACVGTGLLCVAALVLPARTLDDAQAGDAISLDGEILDVKETAQTTRLRVKTECVLDIIVFDKPGLQEGSARIKGTLEGNMPEILANEIQYLPPK